MPGRLPIKWVTDLNRIGRTTTDSRGRFVREDLPAGAAQWGIDDEGRVRRIYYVCPCGCQELRIVSVSRESNPVGAWAWDGNTLAPTLAPSIKHIPHREGQCDWHGHLRSGEWITE